MQILMNKYGKHKMWMILNATANVINSQIAPAVWCTETTSAHALKGSRGQELLDNVPVSFKTTASFKTKYQIER